MPKNTGPMTQDNMVERVERLLAENAELRAERDALLQKPIDLAKMDSIDDDLGVPDKMIAYYWWQQAQEARAAIAAMNGSDSGALREALVEARAWIFECWGWLMETDLDMTCPMQTDPLEIVEKIDALIGIDAALNTEAR